VKNLPVTPVERLTACLDDLAAAVHRAGVPDELAARLLELSALATMKAVELEVRTAGHNTPDVSATPAAHAAPTLLAA
jgi:hypothetical protein